MKLRKMFKALGRKLAAKAVPSTVYGKPVHLGDRVVIPVANVSFGFGGSATKGEPAGGGGGLQARPVGVIEVTPTGTRFIPIYNQTRLSVDEVAPGIMRLSADERCCTVLHAGGEAAIVDLPPGADFAFLVRDRLEAAKLQVRWLCVTSGSFARSDGLVEFRQAFPQARLIAHQSLLDDTEFARHEGRQREFGGNGSSDALVDEVFKSFDWRGDIGGEPFFLLHAPKHSRTDHLAVFRGALLCGDWNLDGPEPADCPVSPKAQKKNKRHVAETLSASYDIHTLVPSEGPPRAARIGDTIESLGPAPSA